MSKRNTRNEILKKRYQVLRKSGYSSQEANKLKHRSLDVGNITLKVSPVTKKTYAVNNEGYRELDLDIIVKKNNNVKNKSVLSNWGNLTQNEPYASEMQKRASYIAKRDNKPIEYGYYYLYVMHTQKVGNNEMKDIVKTDKSFEIYVKKGLVRNPRPKIINKPKEIKRKVRTMKDIDRILGL